MTILCSKYRNIILSFLLLACISVMATAYADNYGLTFKKGGYYDSRNQVYDADGVLNDEELLNLYFDRIKPLTEKYGAEIVVYLTKSLYLPIESEKAALEKAYEDGDYGLGPEKTGSIIYINYNTRRVRCSYFGELKDKYEKRAQKVAENTTPFLKESDTLGAIDYYLKDLEQGLIEIGIVDDAGNRIAPPFRVSIFKFIRNLWVYIISGLLAAAITGVKLLRYKGKKTVNEYTYSTDEDFVLALEKDSFYNTVTTRSKIEKSSSSSSGGGGSSSSGGASF